METRVGGAADVAHLADLIWRFAGDDGPPAASEQAFAEDFRVWWEAQGGSHVPFLAVLSSGRAIGMAWLALTARVPRPGQADRSCGDVQSVYVVPEHRGAGVGTALMRTLLQHTEALRLEHVTVHCNQRAASLYERVGFGTSRDLLLRTYP